MSGTSVQTIWLVVDAINRRDEDRLLELLSEDVRWFTSLQGVGEPPAYVGHAGVSAAVDELRRRQPQVIVEIKAARDLGRSVLWHARSTGLEQPGLPLASFPVWGMYDFERGAVAEMRHYLDYTKAALETEMREHSPQEVAEAASPDACAGAGPR